MGAPDQCQLMQIAFCDTFQTIVGGGREGDLDPAKWSFSRLSQLNNPSQGLLDNYAPFNAEFCMTHQTRLADNDSFICGQQFGESNHWMEGMDDNGQYAMNSLMARQPFDFAGRTGNVVWDVDAKTEGGHSFWNEVWLTDEPVPAPHLDHPGTHTYPRNGVMLLFDGDWCGDGYGQQLHNALRQITVFTNYQQTDYSVRGPCFTTQSDHANHFQFKISQTHMEVWASDAGGANFRNIGTVNTPALPFTRGYVSFQHAQYNAHKFNSTATMTYHWHALGFDGPVIPADRGYEVPDALQKRSDGTINLGYQTPTTNVLAPQRQPCRRHQGVSHLQRLLVRLQHRHHRQHQRHQPHRQRPQPRRGRQLPVALRHATGQPVRPPQRHQHHQPDPHRLHRQLPHHRQHQPRTRPQLTASSGVRPACCEPARSPSTSSVTRAVLSRPKRSSAMRRDWLPIDDRRSASASSVSSADASSRPSPRLVMNPLTPGSTMSAVPPTSDTTTGKPQPIASTVAMPNASARLGRTKTSACW